MCVDQVPTPGWGSPGSFWFRDEGHRSIPARAAFGRLSPFFLYFWVFSSWLKVAGGGVWTRLLIRSVYLAGDVPGSGLVSLVSFSSSWLPFTIFPFC